MVDIAARLTPLIYAFAAWALVSFTVDVRATCFADELARIIVGFKHMETSAELITFDQTVIDSHDSLTSFPEVIIAQREYINNCGNHPD